MERSEYLLQFINDCYQENSIEHIMATAYRYYGNPCALYDRNYKILACYGQAKESDQIFRETVKNKYLSKKVLDYFLQEGYLSENYDLLDTSSIPTVYSEDQFASKRIGITIPSKANGIGGWIAVFETDRSINENDLYLTSWLAKILSPLLDLKSGEIYIPRAEDILIDLLNGVTEAGQAKESLEQFGYYLPMEIKLLTIAYGSGKIPEPAEVVVRSVFDKGDIIINYHDDILVLVDSDKASDTINKLEETLNKLNLYVSVSQPFKTINRLQHCYTQNLQCMKIGSSIKPEERVHWFENYTSELLLFFASRNMEISEYSNPLLKRIVKYDQENDTDYYESLLIYVLYSNNMKKAAAELGIHRNTLSYRINMISKLFDIDLYDQNVIMKLHLAYAIEDCRKLI